MKSAPIKAVVAPIEEKSFFSSVELLRLSPFEYNIAVIAVDLSLIRAILHDGLIP